MAEPARQGTDVTDGRGLLSVGSFYRERRTLPWSLRLKELREKLTQVGIDAIFSCFNLKTTLPAGAAALGQLNPIAAGTAVVAFGAIPVFRAKRKEAQELLDGSEVSYLYRMEQDLKPMDLWSKIKQRLLEFELGI